MGDGLDGAFIRLLLDRVRAMGAQQSIEHAASLRLIPNLDVWRPGDTAETAVAWTVGLQSKSKPTALLLSRQNISYAPKGDSAVAPDASGIDAISKGAYVLAEPTEVGLKKKAQAVIIATIMASVPPHVTTRCSSGSIDTPLCLVILRASASRKRWEPHVTAYW